MIWIGLFGGIVILGLLTFLVLRNALIGSRNLADAAFADMDALLLKRHELIPKLVQITQGYSQHEAKVLEEIAEKRSDVFQNAENDIQQLRAKIQVIKEAYPDLKADANFDKLMTQIKETEDQLLYSRRFYNGTVETYNRQIESFPYSLISSSLGFSRKNYVEVSPDVHEIPNTHV